MCAVDIVGKSLDCRRWRVDTLRSQGGFFPRTDVRVSGTIGQEIGHQSISIANEGRCGRMFFTSVTDAKFVGRSHVEDGSRIR